MELIKKLHVARIWSEFQGPLIAALSSADNSVATPVIAQVRASGTRAREERERLARPVNEEMTTTYDDLTGYRVVKILGVVRGVGVRGLTPLRMAKDGLKGMIGGDFKAYKAANVNCNEEDEHLGNEAYLLSMKGLAEHYLSEGDSQTV